MKYSFKYLKNFSRYILEQDMIGTTGMDGTEIQSAPTNIKYSFIFIEEDDEGTDKYPDGTSSRLYLTYSITKSDLEDWAKSNIKNTKNEEGLKVLDIKRNAVTDYIKGIKNTITPENKEYLILFKNQVKSEIIGEKIGHTEVIFYPEEKTYGTDKIDVTFILIPKK